MHGQQNIKNTIDISRDFCQSLLEEVKLENSRYCFSPNVCKYHFTVEIDVTNFYTKQLKFCSK